MLNQTLNIDKSKKIDIVDTTTIKWGWLPSYAQDNQMKRLLKYNMPKYVGLKVISMNFPSNNNFITGHSTLFRKFEAARINPYRKMETIKIIKLHHEKNPDLYKKINLKYF